MTIKNLFLFPPSFFATAFFQLFFSAVPSFFACLPLIDIPIKKRHTARGRRRKEERKKADPQPKPSLRFLHFFGMSLLPPSPFLTLLLVPFLLSSPPGWILLPLPHLSLLFRTRMRSKGSKGRTDGTAETHEREGVSGPASMRGGSGAEKVFGQTARLGCMGRRVSPKFVLRKWVSNEEYFLL